MIKVVTNMILRAGGLLTAFIFACNHLNSLDSILDGINKIDIASNSLNIGLLTQINYKIGFIVLCLVVILVCYYMFNQLVKTLCEEYNTVTAERRRKMKEEAQELREIVAQELNRLAPRTIYSPESRVITPKDPREINKRETP